MFIIYLSDRKTITTIKWNIMPFSTNLKDNNKCPFKQYTYTDKHGHVLMYTECDETKFWKCKEGYLYSRILNSKRRQDKTRGKFYHFRNLVLLSLLSHKTSFMECCVMVMMLWVMVWCWHCLYSTGWLSFFCIWHWFGCGWIWRWRKLLLFSMEIIPRPFNNGA